MRNNKEASEEDMIGERVFSPPIAEAAQMRTVHNYRLTTSLGFWQCGAIACMTGILQLAGFMPFRKGKL